MYNRRNEKDSYYYYCELLSYPGLPVYDVIFD